MMCFPTCCALVKVIIPGLAHVVACLTKGAWFYALAAPLPRLSSAAAVCDDDYRACEDNSNDDDNVAPEPCLRSEAHGNIENGPTI